MPVDWLMTKTLVRRYGRLPGFPPPRSLGETPRFLDARVYPGNCRLGQSSNAAEVSDQYSAAGRRASVDSRQMLGTLCQQAV